jgi:hypothetical protein
VPFEKKKKKKKTDEEEEEMECAYGYSLSVPSITKCQWCKSYTI